MSLLVANAEHALATCLECMEEVLTSCIEDAMPQTSLSLPDEVQDTEGTECKNTSNSEHFEELEEQQKILHEHSVNSNGNVAQTRNNRRSTENGSEGAEMASMVTSSAHQEQNQDRQDKIKCEEKEKEIVDDIPDTLKQRLEWEMTQEHHRVVALWQELHWRIRELQSSLVQLGGGVNNSGQLVDIPVESLDRDIAKLSSENAKLGQQMIELYNEADCIADRLTCEIMSANVENL